MKAYRKRQHVVIALRWAGEHPSSDLERILGGPATVKATGTGEPSLQVFGYSRGVKRIEYAHVGDWLVRTPDSAHAMDGALEVLTNEEFEAQYEPAEQTAACTCSPHVVPSNLTCAAHRSFGAQ